VSRGTSGWTDNKRDKEKYLFMVKKNNEKWKYEIKRIRNWHVNDVPSKFFDICSHLYQSHPLVFLAKVKKRCFYVGGDGRERGSVENIFFRFSISFNIFFFVLKER